MTKQLTVINGGRKSIMKDVYEVRTVEGDIVDVMRFNSPEEAAEFESGLVGDYLVKPHRLSAEELLEVVLDLRIDELLDVDRQKGSGLVMDEKVLALVEKIKGLPEFQADGKEFPMGGYFSISVECHSNISLGEEPTTTYSISVYEGFGGETLGEKFIYEVGMEGFSTSESDGLVSESEIIQTIQGHMQKFAGVPVDGVFPE